MTNFLLIVSIILLLGILWFGETLISSSLSVAKGVLQVSENQVTIAENQLLILKNNKIMSQTAEEIKGLLVEANEKALAVAADVTGLHAKIDALGDAPTAEQLAEIKELATQLKNSLVETDAMTEDAPPTGPVEENTEPSTEG